MQNGGKEPGNVAAEKAGSRFEDIGYDTGAGPDGLTMVTRNGRFELISSKDGSGFDLVVESNGGEQIVCRRAGLGAAPDPRIL